MTQQEQVLTLEELDDLLDELDELDGEESEGRYAPLIGRSVDWHGSLTGTLVVLRGGLYIEAELTCRCGREHETVYLGSGLHRGAWCYVFNEKAEYQANLRDQDYVCAVCSNLSVRDYSAEFIGNDGRPLP